MTKEDIRAVLDQHTAWEGHTRLAAASAELAQRFAALEEQNRKLVEVLEIIKDTDDESRPYRGWHRVRQWLENRGQFIEDLGDERGLQLMCNLALLAQQEHNNGR